jgi:hypothetical protein
MGFGSYTVTGEKEGEKGSELNGTVERLFAAQLLASRAIPIKTGGYQHSAT